MDKNFPIQLNLELTPIIDIENIKSWEFDLQGLYVKVKPKIENLSLCKTYFSTSEIGYYREEGDTLYLEFIKFIKSNNKNKFTLNSDLYVLALLYDTYRNDNKDLILNYEQDLYNISWFTNNIYYNEVISPKNLLAFLSLDLYFTANEKTWSSIKDYSLLENKIGKGYISLDNNIQIYAYQPNLLENLNLSVLFKINKNVYGTVYSEFDNLNSNNIYFDQNTTNIVNEINSNKYDLDLNKFVIYKKDDKKSKFNILGNILDYKKKIIVICNKKNVIGWNIFQKNNNLPFYIVDLNRKIDMNLFDFDMIVYDIDYEDISNTVQLKKFDSVYNLSKIILVNLDEFSHDELNDLLADIKPSEFSKNIDIFHKYPNYPDKYLKNHINYYIRVPNIIKRYNDLEVKIISEDISNESNLSLLDKKLALLLEDINRKKYHDKYKKIQIIASNQLEDSNIFKVLKNKYNEITILTSNNELDTDVKKVIILDISLLNLLLLKKIKDMDILILVDNNEIENFNF